MRRGLLLAAAWLLAMAACETVDLGAEEEGGEPPQPSTLPVGCGRGTRESPYTVRQWHGSFARMDAECWVIGYVVGATYRKMENADFRPGTQYSSNILLAADTLATSAGECLPVELATASLQKAYALTRNRRGFHQCLMLCGQPALYFGVTGMRGVRAGQWLYGFDMRDIAPQDWEVDSIPQRHAPTTSLSPPRWR